MPRSKSLMPSLLAGLSTLALAGAAHAQTPPPGGPQAGPPGQMRMQMQQRMTERRAERNKDLATVLRLRPDQLPALEAFVASQTPPMMRDGRQGGPGFGPPGAPGPREDRRNMTTPQRLDQQAQRGQERQAAMQRRAQGLRTFYAALNPDQQQVFDALTRLRGADGHGGGGQRMRLMMRGPGPGGPGGGPPTR